MDAEVAHAAIARRRAEIVARADGVALRLREIRAARGDWIDEEHDPEGFTLTHEWSQAQGARARMAASLRDLDGAEHRLAVGDYGTCAVCGAAIPDAQLERQPERSACVACTDRRS